MIREANGLVPGLVWIDPKKIDWPPGPGNAVVVLLFWGPFPSVRPNNYSMQDWVPLSGRTTRYSGRSQENRNRRNGKARIALPKRRESEGV